MPPRRWARVPESKFPVGTPGSKKGAAAVVADASKDLERALAAAGGGGAAG